MSTFDGIVAEFPHIRIDYFRTSTQASHQAPLALFLSHVHSDHLVGLETCKAPFIYCSPATRDILLRLEKYPHRMNFARGVLEVRRQTYRHLKTLLKAIPLDTPTQIQLAPGRDLRVTLLDANHCVGAVMFLIEADGRAILYTGDIRAEPWWLDSMTRHPALMPYLAFGDARRLDCIYLDTTFATKDDPYREFPSKAAGVQELLRSVARYPPETCFYFQAWTFGYEDVWQALSGFLNSQVHVDDYRYGLYRALANGIEPKAPEAARLTGFYCGNHHQKGCLTTDQSRIHSCEKGTGCEVWKQKFVRILPIISRHKGAEMVEIGAGGGHNDLNQQHELEIGDPAAIAQLIALSIDRLKDQGQLDAIRVLLSEVVQRGDYSISLDQAQLATDQDDADADVEAHADLDNLPLDQLVPLLARLVRGRQQQGAQMTSHGVSKHRSEPAANDTSRLPKTITFPYSRHSSYSELCGLIAEFKPKDICPCTVDEENWTAARSMQFLFGHLYDKAPSFSHDQIMLRKHGSRMTRISNTRQSPSPAPEASGRGDFGGLVDVPIAPPAGEASRPHRGDQDQTANLSGARASNKRKRDAQTQPSSDEIGVSEKQETSAIVDRDDASAQSVGLRSRLYDPAGQATSPPSTATDIPSSSDTAARIRAALRLEAYHAALGTDGASWADIGLVSIDGHQTREEEL